MIQLMMLEVDIITLAVKKLEDDICLIKKKYGSSEVTKVASTPLLSDPRRAKTRTTIEVESNKIIDLRRYYIRLFAFVISSILTLTFATWFVVSLNNDAAGLMYCTFGVFSVYLLIKIGVLIKNLVAVRISLKQLGNEENFEVLLSYLSTATKQIAFGFIMTVLSVLTLLNTGYSLLTTFYTPGFCIMCFI